jgi:ATP/maltotriose-dependent transcriptional regulator MalT
LTDETAMVVAEICRRLDGPPLAIELAALGALCRLIERPETAALLLAAADRARERAGTPAFLHELNVRRAVADTRATLGETRFARHTAAGRDLRPAQTLAEGRRQLIELANPRAITLSRRRREILRLLIDGRTNREIAANHLTGVLAALNGETRTAAIAKALREPL